MRAKTLKFLEENREINLHEFRLHDDALRHNTKNKKIHKIGQLNFIKNKMVCDLRDIIKK